MTKEIFKNQMRKSVCSGLMKGDIVVAVTRGLNTEAQSVQVET